MSQGKIFHGILQLDCILLINSKIVGIVQRVEMGSRLKEEAWNVAFSKRSSMPGTRIEFANTRSLHRSG